MIEKPSQFDEFIPFFFKVILPSIMGVSIQVATRIKREKMSYFNIFLSYVVGISLCCLCYPVVEDSVGQRWVAFIVGIIAITGNNIAEFVIYKLNIDLFLASLFEAFRQSLLNMLNKKQ